MTSHPVDCAVRDAPWFRSGGRVLVAVSGGPDSMALLHGAAALVPSGVRVVAAHFDHRIREDSARDLETVRALAEARGIHVIAGAGDVPARARTARVSMETAARDARYQFLRAAAAEADAAFIATAHTRSDHVETVLMRILRGAGERGLAGIARERDGVVRPLLDVTRADTLDYCRRHGIAFVEDPSNCDRRFTRNAVRHDVLPALRRVYPGIDDALVRMSQRAEETLNAARRVTDGRLSGLRRENDTWVLPVDALAGLDDSEAAILLGDVMERVGCLEDVTAVQYGHLRALARVERVGASAHLPGAAIRRDHDALVWRVRGVESREEPRAVRLGVPGEIELNGWIVSAASHAEVVPRRTRAAAEYVALVPATIDPSSLVVRSPRPGDRIQPFGMKGTRKLSDVFIDQKVPHRERARVIVVEAGGEIVWVPGVVAAESTRVRDGDAPVLRLTASREVA
ncbi:MAG TPA: tRNA lysidine(34) synthetase TilS [Candidatus Krumholzibacteria bacterium]|nr:tRNA lysidine(34) synthetase TilS [Candidatus Krumholzibacteria bacterium]